MTDQGGADTMPTKRPRPNPATKSVQSRAPAALFNARSERLSVERLDHEVFNYVQATKTSHVTSVHELSQLPIAEHPNM